MLMKKINNVYIEVDGTVVDCETYIKELQDFNKLLLEKEAHLTKVIEENNDQLERITDKGWYKRSIELWEENKLLNDRVTCLEEENDNLRALATEYDMLKDAYETISSSDDYRRNLAEAKEAFISSIGEEIDTLYSDIVAKRKHMGDPHHFITSILDKLLSIEKKINFRGGITIDKEESLTEKEEPWIHTSGCQCLHCKWGRDIARD